MISVIMLTHNREDLVPRAIESVLCQTYSDFEFIIVDNGSSDASGKIADNYAAEDDRICVIHRDEGSIGAGRNTGLDAVKGEYIAFVDDDDEITPDYLEFLFGLIKNNGADISVCGTSVRHFDEKLVMSSEEALMELMRRKYYNTGFPTKLFRRELTDGLRFSENVRYDDIGIMYKLVGNAKRTVYHGLPKYVVYRHGDNNSAWTTNHSLLDGKTLNEYLEAYRDRTEWMSARFPNRASDFRYFEWSFMISMVEKINRLGIKDCGKQLENMLKELRVHREEFLASSEIKDFEREWTEKYIGV